jgi:tetratricopeptide (TPR) repeat protein
LSISPAAIKASSRPPLDAQNPWPGLDSFHEADRQFFRGRTRDASELLALVKRARISVLYGVSGIGKSSLLEAGLFPLLREQGILPVRIRLDYSSEGSELVSQLKHAITAQAAASHVEAPAPNELETLWEYFHRRDQNFWDERNRLITPLLVLDQFEELFTLGSDRPLLTPKTRDFVTQLADLAEGSAPDVLREWLETHPEDASKFFFGRHQYRILISMREDFLAQLDDFRIIMPSIASNRKRLFPMDGHGALGAASQAPDLMPVSVAEQVVRFVGTAETTERDLAELVVDPALLSVMCSELNEKRKRRGDPMITADLLEGSRDEILRDFYERAMQDVNRPTRTFVEEKLILDPGYRDTVALHTALQNPGVTRDDLEQLVRHRLIRIEQRGAVRRLELTHDLLVGVILKSRDQRHIQEKAEQEKAARIEAEARERQAHRALRKTRIFAGVFVLVSLAAITAAVFAFVAQSHANLNKHIAENAVDTLAGLAGSHSVETPLEAPETLAFREQLLTKAQQIYSQFNSRDQSSEDMRRETAMGHFHSGDLCRLRGEVQKAITQYQLAIQQLTALVYDFPTEVQYSNDLAEVYNWLGETERPFSNRSADAETAYDHALTVQTDLTRKFPMEPNYRRALADTYDNRGILRQNTGRYAEAEADFRNAIGLLTALTRTSARNLELLDAAREDLARADNNLALLLRSANQRVDARTLFDRAIQLGETLTNDKPNNRQYKLELAQWNNNSAILLQDSDAALARQRNERAIELITQLTQPAPYVLMQLGLFHSARGLLFDHPDTQTAAKDEYQLAIKTFEAVPPANQDRSFHAWLGDALTNLAIMQTTSDQDEIRLLLQAIEQEKAAGSNYHLAWDYYYLGVAYKNLQSLDKMQQALRNARDALSGLSEVDRQQLTQLLDGVTTVTR